MNTMVLLGTRFVAVQSLAWSALVCVCGIAWADSSVSPMVGQTTPSAGPQPSANVVSVTYTPIRTSAANVLAVPTVAPTITHAEVPPSAAISAPPLSADSRTSIATSVRTPLALSFARDTEPTVAVAAVQPRKPTRRVFGVASDVGMPDGLQLGLVLEPVDWLRLCVSMGTTSLADPELTGLYRGGFTLIPHKWAPSFTFEVGHRDTAPTTGVIREFFNVAAWVKPYVQQLGYTFFNAHVGYDWTRGHLTLFAHAGYTYLLGTVRAPDSVVVDKSTNTSVTIASDGSLHALTLSAKLGASYLFGGI